MVAENATRENEEPIKRLTANSYQSTRTKQFLAGTQYVNTRDNGKTENP